MVAHPAIVKRFNWMLGVSILEWLTLKCHEHVCLFVESVGLCQAGWQGSNGGGAVSVNRVGSTGQELHAGGKRGAAGIFRSWHGHALKLNYSWQLQDVLLPRRWRVNSCKTTRLLQL